MNDTKFGYSKRDRINFINANIAHATKTRKVEYEGVIQELKVINVPIELPIYRINNIRTLCAQKEYCETHDDVDYNDFINNPESVKSQIVQNEILLKMVNQQNLFDEFKKQNEKGQTESLIITPEAIVVNGNRRLCAWRKLYYENPSKYGQYQMIEVAVLPDSNEDKINDLEYRLQIKNDLRADYAWYARALSYKMDLEKPGIDIDVIKKKKNIDQAEVLTLIEEYDLAEDYLERIGKKNQWSLVDNELYSFQQIVKLTKKFIDESKPTISNVLKDVAFSIVLANYEGSIREKTGRLYEFIPQIGNYANEVIEDLKNKVLGDSFKQEREKAPATIADETIVGRLLRNVPAEKVANTAVHTINARQDIEKELKNKRSVLDDMIKARQILGGCVVVMKEDQSKAGIDEEIKKIEFYIGKLKEWLDE